MEQEVQERIIKKYNDICELLAEEIMLPNLTQEQNDEFEKITEVVCAIAYRKKKVFELMEELIEMGEDYFEKKSSNTNRNSFRWRKNK